ncbi:hypothetical protein VB834_24335 [Limnoraphis robusta Tam1]|uniref:hypothetical protein n=1 Tax=Limnoraphis robusta TaxID=1118279 RepID=UPI002B2012AA|nr:hypothetical protein [Limnoraphis robusta]MEA5542166.1 hypothetical protein [Limnoraphis robusta Tam1]
MSSLKDETQGNPEAVESSKSKKSKWPVWFPYPSSWLRMTVLILWTAIVVRFFMFWGMNIGETLSDIFNHKKPLLQALGIAVFGSILVHSYLYYILVDQDSSPSKKTFPTSRSLWEGTYAMIVLILSILISVLIISPFFPWENCYFSRTYETFICPYRFQSYADNLSILGVVVWLTSGLYLYQLEYVIRNKVPLKRIVRFVALIILSIVVSLSLNTMIKKGDNIYGFFSNLPEPSVTTASTEEYSDIESIETYPESFSEYDHRENEEFVNTEHDASYDDVYDDVEYDTFYDALNAGMEAAILAQTAKSAQEWNKVSEIWKEAIELLEDVPESSPNLEIAQNKIVEYQKNLNYSQQQANQNAQYEALIPPDLNFKKGLEEASSAAFFVQTAKSKPEWEFVATQWQNAIVYMKQVQPSDTNYKAAQERVVQYQKNLEYARLAGSQAKE